MNLPITSHSKSRLLKKTLPIPEVCFFSICCFFLPVTILFIRHKVIRRDGRRKSFQFLPAFVVGLDSPGVQKDNYLLCHYGSDLLFDS